MTVTTPSETPVAEVPRSSGTRLVDRVFKMRELAILVVFLVMIAVTQAGNSQFLSEQVDLRVVIDVHAGELLDRAHQQVRSRGPLRVQAAVGGRVAVGVGGVEFRLSVPGDLDVRVAR